jgi:hypothetical protein
MSIISLKVKFITTRLFCFLFGHRIITTRNITHHFKEYKCTACGLELTNDDKRNKTFLTRKLKAINNVLKSFYLKKSLQHT